MFVVREHDVNCAASSVRLGRANSMVGVREEAIGEGAQATRLGEAAQIVGEAPICSGERDRIRHRRVGTVYTSA
jgi:hypothetical protein